MTLRASVLFAALAASLSACSKDEPEPVPYDGPWAPLEETGDWVDPGSLAECSVPNPYGNCGTLPTFDISTCDLSSLSTLERNGAIYRAELRYETTTGIEPGLGGFEFAADGSLLRVMGLEPSASQVSSDMLLLSSKDTDRFTFIGCKATGPRTLTGCFAWCRDNRLRHRATFRAERMTWREGETESSGLTLVSESHVELGKPADVYVTQGHAYVVSITRGERHGGLTVFDLSDARHPVQTAALELPGDFYWNGVWSKDNALYVASQQAGVLVYDITDPAHPAFVRRATVPGKYGAINVHTVFVEGDRLYAMAPSSVETYIFDISNPLEPQLVSRYALPESRGYPHDAFAYEGRLYINHTYDGFLVVDPRGEEPKLLGKYNYPYSFSHANAVGTFNGRTIAFEGGENLGAHLRVLDVTNPASIAKVGEYKLRNLNSIHNMVLRGSRLYVAHYQEGVRVLDVADPSKPREVAYYNTFRESDPDRTDGMYEGAIGMRVPGDGHIYVIDTSRGLLLFDEQ
ncbi:hypothetical protein JY651_41800 [Pyxidicoccus parkwayensis]|uniref:Lipoprotein n=1 Tax=Pyxidicoccus parkwayensis TaxID=2813578 RepID=A0ABX7NTD7_9BACT|nr:hypothetical protein [Pyxidicoccus parkwaysis]QSQ21639.1 hypothetical protein JY651_41800 [Pyxidicoccus parkwaysis]